MFDFFRVTPKKRVIRVRSKKGVIYSNPGYKQRFIFGLGNTIFLGALIGLLYVYMPLGKVVFEYYIMGGVSNGGVNVVTSGNESQKETEGEGQAEKSSKNFEITIPKINAYSQVEENISPFDRSAYEAVLDQDKVVHANSSALPGAGRGHSVFIFAHSSESGLTSVRKNPAFYLLGELDNGDEATVDRNGQKYVYRVYDKKIIKANETDYLYYGDPSREVLILQTCWPIGTNWRRLLVFGELVKD